MHRTTRRLLTLGSIAAVLIAALVWAAVSFANAGQELEGTHWNLTEITGQPPVLADPAVTLEFGAEQHVGGNASCNSYGGTYAVDGQSLSFSQVFSTKMACVDEGRNAQENAYLSALENVASYDLAGDTLTLKDASGATLLVFTRAQ